MNRKKRKYTHLVSCPVCGEELVRETRNTLLRYKHKEIRIAQPGQYCISCGESFLSPSDLAATRKIRTDFQREADHLLQSDEIKAIRKKMHLTQRNAGTIFGGGPMAFSKYERGIIKQTRSLDLIMRLLSTQKISLEDVLDAGKQPSS